MNDSKGKPEAPNPNDPKLRAFLRQARAVIAAERGLNTKSQLKLESLAGSLRLPEELYELAIEALKHEQNPGEASHWEKGFLEFLNRELDQYENNILTVNMQQRAVKIAKSKFQLTEIRAMQLIAQTAERREFSRVSSDDARRHVINLILDRIGDRPTVAKATRKQIYDSATAWGMSHEQADEIVLEQLVRNRSSLAGKRRLKWIGYGMILLSVAGIGFAAVQYEWLQIAKAALRGDGVTVEKENANSNDIPDNLAAKFSSNWLNEESLKELQELSKRVPSLEFGLNKLAHDDPGERAQGYPELVSYIGDPKRESVENVEAMLARVLTLEPNERVCEQAIEQMVERIKPQSTMGKFEGAYQYLETLSRVASKMGGDRAKLFSQRIGNAAGSNRAIVDLTGEKIALHESLAGAQWAYLVQQCWTSPARFALQVDPLYELTKSKLDRTLLNQYRHRTIDTVLEVEPGRWRDLKNSIRSAVEVSDEIRVNHWIEKYLALDGGQYQEFLGQLLMTRTGVQPESNSREAIRAAIVKHKQTFRNQQLEPLTRRHATASALFRNLNNLLNQNEESVSPDKVAKSIYVSNVELAAVGLDMNQPDKLSEFDRRWSQGLPTLRNEVSLSARQSQVLSSTPASASDNRRKRELFAKLDQIERGNQSSLISTIKQLAEVSQKFDDVPYSEAEVLANYCLSRLPLAESLNVERHLGSFKDWPNFLLAIADQLPDSDVSLDQAMTIFALLSGQNFESDGASGWQSKIADRIYRLVQERLATQNSGAESERRDWSRLQIYLRDASFQRLTHIHHWLHGSSRRSPIVNSDTIVDQVVALLVDNAMFQQHEQIHRSANLIRATGKGELAQIVMADHLLFDWFAGQIKTRFPGTSPELGRLEKELRAKSRDRSLGEQLFWIELYLTKLSSLLRTRTLEAKFSES